MEMNYFNLNIYNLTFYLLLKQFNLRKLLKTFEEKQNLLQIMFQT